MTDSPAQPLDVAAGRTLAPAAVCMRGITKLYPGVVANDAIDFSVEAASIHGLLGENGAGKSTLMKVLFGLTTPTAGTVEIAGQQVVVDSAGDALDLGIGMVQQHFSLIADFTVAENLVLGREPLRRGGLLDLDRAAADIAELSDRYGFRIDPRSRVGDLAVGARQRVEILKALYRGAEVLILDEPTAALAPNEVAELVTLLRRLRDQGRTVVFISHKLSEVIDLCDRVTVLRGGRVEGHREIGTAERDDPARHDALAAELARMMVGRELPEPPERTSGPAGADVPVLRLEAAGDGRRLGPIDLEVLAGEIVGVAGVEGNGQTELVEMVVGVRRCRTGSVHLGRTDVTRWSVRRRLATGVAHIAEDRHGAGVADGLDLAHNATLGFHSHPPFSWRGMWLSLVQMRRLARGVVNRFGVQAVAVTDPLRSLSGGNQQKLVVGRELSRGPELFVAAQPTRGLDVAAAAFVHSELAELRRRGAGVLLVSLELTEILALADRIVVMSGGQIAGETTPGEVDVTTLGRWMTGGGLDGRARTGRSRLMSATGNDSRPPGPQSAEPQSSDPQPAEPHPGADPQSSDPQPAERQSADPQSSDPQPAERQSADPQSSDPQPAERQSADPQSSDPQPAERQSADPQSSDPQPADPQPAERQPAGPQSSHPRPGADPQPADPQPADPQSSHPRPGADPQPGGEPRRGMAAELQRTLDSAGSTVARSAAADLAQGAGRAAAIFVATVLAALVLAAPLIIAAGSDPFAAYGALYDGSLGGQRPVAETLVSMTPLLFGGLAVAIAFQAGLFNIGVEGQLVAGGLAAGVVAIKVSTWAPAHVLLALLAGAAAGGLWALVPAALKAWRGVHEVITTIMMNFVAFSVSQFLVKPGGALVGEIPTGTEPVQSSAELPRIWHPTRLHMGIVVALIVAGACWYFIYRTPGGYRFRLVGANPVVARFNGISSNRVIVEAMLLSGALGGLTGAVEVLGTHRRYLDSFSPGYGFDSIAVALLGALHPVGVAAASFFFGLLRAGSTQLQLEAGITRDMITVISGLVVACVAARLLLSRRAARSRQGELRA